MANSADPDEMPHSVASHLGLYCLLRPVCPNTYGKYGMSKLPCSGNSSKYPQLFSWRNKAKKYLYGHQLSGALTSRQNTIDSYKTGQLFFSDLINNLLKAGLQCIRDQYLSFLASLTPMHLPIYVEWTLLPQLFGPVTCFQ